MPSFDIVSRVDFQEIDNAIANALREITNRYDFKGSNTSVERKEKIITIVTDDDLKLSQVDDILISHFVRRKLDPLALGKKDKEKTAPAKKPSPKKKTNIKLESVTTERSVCRIKCCLLNGIFGTVRHEPRPTKSERPT